MNKTLCLLSVMLLSACEDRTRFVGCTREQERDGLTALKIAVRAFPESADTLERMRVSCELFDPWPGAECVTWSYPTNTAYGLAEFRIDLVGECLLHEAQHYELRSLGIEDGCQSHKEDCGWDKFLLETALDKL